MYFEGSSDGGMNNGRLRTDDELVYCNLVALAGESKVTEFAALQGSIVRR